MISPTEHISNFECSNIFENILNKVFIKASENAAEMINNPKDKLTFSIRVLNKIRLQFSSSVYLTYRNQIDSCHTYNTILDISSVYTIIRSIYETFLVNDFIFNQSTIFRKEYNLPDEVSDDEIVEFKYLLFCHDSSKQLPEIINYCKPNQSKEMDLLIENDQNNYANHKIYSLMEEHKKNNLTNKWRPKWETMIKKCGMDVNWSLFEYKIMSLYSHNSNNIVDTITYFYNNQKKFDKNSINCFLYSVVSFYINSMSKYWLLNNSDFTSDEYNLMCEFYKMAFKGKDSFNDKNA